MTRKEMKLKNPILLSPTFLFLKLIKNQSNVSVAYVYLLWWKTLRLHPNYVTISWNNFQMGIDILCTCVFTRNVWSIPYMKIRTNNRTSTCTCKVHQRRGEWWQCLTFSKLRCIFSLKAVWKFWIGNDKNGSSSWQLQTLDFLK